MLFELKNIANEDTIDIYNMTQAVEDGAIVPIYYENRAAKIKLLKEIDAEYEKMTGSMYLRERQ